MLVPGVSAFRRNTTGLVYRPEFKRQKWTGEIKNFLEKRKGKTKADRDKPGLVTEDVGAIARVAVTKREFPDEYC